METKQKQVKLIGIRVKNNGIIQAAELTPDLLQKRLVLITGETGNGKSTLLNSAKIAVSGTSAIKKSDALQDDFVAEALMRDGDVPIYIGVKTDKFSRGENAGKQKVVTYLYTKDANGKNIQPVIDGVQWTAAQYWSALTTDLTHSLNDLFSENQVVHKRLIENLFRSELGKFDLDKLEKEILELRKERDVKRLVCQSNGAYMERFIDEGWNETSLGLIEKKDIADLRQKLSQLNVTRGAKLLNVESEYNMACMRIDNERRDHIAELESKVDEITETLKSEELALALKYQEEMCLYNSKRDARTAFEESYSRIKDELYEFLGYDTSADIHDEQGLIVFYSGTQDKNAMSVVYYLEDYYNAALQRDYIVPDEPVLGRVSSDTTEALKRAMELRDEAVNTPSKYPEKGTVDTSDIDEKISSLESEISVAEQTNRIYDRYQMWQEWIGAKESYESKLDELRRLYASVDTGVQGLRIVPRETESGKLEIWAMYDGSYNPEYFSNPKKESRFMFDYSSFQRTIIGLMLQSACLDKKPKALRLAFVDDVAFTPRDIDVLTDISERLDLRLITAWTHEADSSNLLDGQVLIDGGEIFFNIQE